VKVNSKAAALEGGPSVEDAEGIAALRQIFEREGYTSSGVTAAFGEDGTFTRDPLDVPVYLRRLEQGTKLATLIKLFLLDVAVPTKEAARALEPLTLERVEAMGLVERRGKETRAVVNVFPSGELVFTSDMYEGDKTPGRADHVLGLSISSRVLSSLTVRRPVGSALDLGTGSGVQALAAASHAGRVVGVDINARALRFGRFNALLNGFRNIEMREGSLFDPVEGETFDLIVANPPYVISPETEFIYRDSGLPGDSFTEGLVRRLPEFMNEGAFATVLLEWVHPPQEEWSQPLRRWIEGSGCDALLVHYMSQDPLSYAAAWNHELRRDPKAYGAALDRWLDYDRRLGIEQIAWGALVLRKRAGDNWVRTVAPGARRIGEAAHHVDRVFEAQDYLASLRIGRGLLEGVFALAEDHRFEQTLVLGGGEGTLEKTVLRLETGFRTEAILETPVVRVLVLLDGRRPLAEVLEEAAASAPEGGDPQAFTLETLPVIVQLLELGLLVPSGNI
jgi:hypothetical protein